MRGEVEERLGAGAHRDDRVVGDGVEVGGDVAGDLGAAVHAADAAGGEDARSPPPRPAPATPTRWSPRTAIAGRSPRAGRARRPCAPGRGSARARPTSMPTRADAVEHGRHRRHGAGVADRRRGSDRAPRRWPATAGRGGRRSSTPARRRRRRPERGGDLGRHDRLDHVRAVADEAGDGLDVGRVRERVDDLGALVAVAGGGEQLGVAPERRRVAADEHEDRGAQSG